jgi:hypothetical protein
MVIPPNIDYMLRTLRFPRASAEAAKSRSSRKGRVCATGQVVPAPATLKVELINMIILSPIEDMRGVLSLEKVTNRVGSRARAPVFIIKLLGPSREI